MSFELYQACFLGLIALLIVIVLAWGGPKLLRSLRGNVKDQVSTPSIPFGTGSYSPPEEESQEDEEEEEDEPLNATVGQTYPLKGSFEAKIRIEKVDEDEEQIFATLLIEVPAGSEIKSVQKAWDGSDETFICVVFMLNGVWKTLTWDWNDAEWPEFEYDDVYVPEVEVTVASSL